jgi:hypothetical protein
MLTQRRNTYALACKAIAVYQFLLRVGNQNPNALLAIKVKQCGNLLLTWVPNNMSLEFDKEPNVRHQLFVANKGESPDLKGYIEESEGKYITYNYHLGEGSPTGESYETLEDAKNVLELLTIIKE